MYDKYSHAVDRHLELEQEGKQPKPISPLLFLIHAFNESYTTDLVYGDRQEARANEVEIDMFAAEKPANQKSALDMLRQGYYES